MIERAGVSYYRAGIEKHRGSQLAVHCGSNVEARNMMRRWQGSDVVVTLWSDFAARKAGFVSNVCPSRSFTAAGRAPGPSLEGVRSFLLCSPLPIVSVCTDTPRMRSGSVHWPSPLAAIT